jgi:hypothetical protein
MADNIAEAISLLTKVSADTAKRLKALEDGKGTVAQKASNVPRKVVKKADPVIVTDFGKKAEKDLAKLGGDADAERARTEKEKNNNGNLLKLLGLAGAAALALKFLFDGEGFTGLVQGFQSAVKTVTKFADKAKGLVDDIGKKVGTFADDVGKKVGTFADDIGKKIGTFADDAVAGLKKIGQKATTFIDDVAGINLKQSMDNIGAKVGAFVDDTVKGLKNVVSKINPFSGQVDELGKAAAKATQGATAGASAAGGTAKKAGFFSRVASGAKNMAVKAGGAVKNVAGKAIQFTKDKILKPVGSAIKKVKPLKLLKGLAKSPLLAPVLESFFAAKDINDTIDQYGAGEIDQKTLNQLVGKRLIEAVTGVIGGAGGAIIGGTLGSVIPVAGNIIGAIAGGVLGDVGGRAIGGLIAKALGDKTGEMGEWALSSPLFKVPEQQSAPVDIEDGIITKDGQVIKPDKDDTLYAMKDGGPLLDVLAKGSAQQTSQLKILTKMNEHLLKEQTEMLQQHAVLLGEIADKIGTGGNNIINNSSSVTNMGNGRGLQGLRDSYAV